MFDTQMDLNDAAIKLISIHSEMYPFVHYGIEDGTWYIRSCDYDEEFDNAGEFIEFIETEVKEALLNYALNGELDMIAEAIA